MPKNRVRFPKGRVMPAKTHFLLSVLVFLSVLVWPDAVAADGVAGRSGRLRVGDDDED